MFTWRAHEGAVTSVAFVPGGGLLSTGTDGVLKHWDVAAGAEHFRWKLAEPAHTPADSNLLRVLADAHGRHAVVGLRSGGAVFLDLNAGREVGRLPLPALHALTLGPWPNSILALATGNVGTHGWPPAHDVGVLEVEFPDGAPIAWSRRPPWGARHGLAASPDGAQVIAGRTRYAWPSGEVSGPVSLATGRLFAVSADGDKLFGANGTRLMVWGLQTGALRQKLKGHVGPITGLTTTPDGRKLWTASADATVRQWDVDTYRCVTCYKLKVGPLGCVAVSPDGATAAAGSAHNGHLAVWDLD